MSSDAPFILRLQSGDLDALGTLYDKYRPVVYRTALAVVRDPDVAEDILQEVFLRLHTYAARVKSDLPLAPWLYRVTINLCYTWFTRNKWFAPLDAFIENVVGPMKHRPEPAAEYRDAQQIMQKAIDALPFNQRVVVILHYLNDLSLQEIAEITSCPLGTVKSRLFYARESLRQQLDGIPLTQEIGYGFTR